MPYAPFRNEETRSSILSALRDPAAQTAWGRFFDTYAGFIYGIARGEGLSEADADETVRRKLAAWGCPPVVVRIPRVADGALPYVDFAEIFA